MCKKEDLLEVLKQKNDIEVLITMGAGNIDRLVPQVAELMKKR